MDNFEFYRPTHYHFGQGEILKVGEIIKECGKHKILVVYGGGSAVRSGLIDSVHKSLTEAGLSYIDVGGVKPNPRADLVYKCIEEGRAAGVDFVLAAGGGSVIDTAKAAAIGMKFDGDFFDEFYVKRNRPSDALGVGVILTIPAAGSEGSDSAVIQKEVDGMIIKQGLSTPFNVPKFAIMDPALTVTLPDYQTACGATDMMAHVMERYFTNTPDVSITDRICEAVLLSIIETVPRILHDPQNYGARANLMWAGTLAHNNLCGVGREQDWATHHLEHQLSALYDCAHGAGLAVMFPAWMEYTMSHNVMRFAQFAVRVFGVQMDFEDPVNTARRGIAALRSFFKSIGMPLNFEDLGAKEEDIPVLLNLLGADKHTEGNFVTLGRDDCEQIYKIAARYSYK